MENVYSSLFNNGSGVGRRQTGNLWDHFAGDTPAATKLPGESEAHALMLCSHDLNGFGSSGYYCYPEPQLTYLKLGKRQYEGHVAAHKMGKPSFAGGLAVQPQAAAMASPASVSVPRCQVDGCNVALLNVKEYHRRHKVCEMHSKAPKVTVFGLEQRFCQQCSRFHAVSEFDEAKRSCRRRLAGHNERRRKSSHEHVLAKNTSPRGGALSLLSSSRKEGPWVSSPDLSMRCSAALLDLIAENRAAVLGRPVIVDHCCHANQNAQIGPCPSAGGNPHAVHDVAHAWDRFDGGAAKLEPLQGPGRSEELM